MIEVTELRKSYGDLIALDGVSLKARSGRIFGLLGPNGAGKSTLIGCISGLLQPTAGRVSVLGHDVVSDPIAARRRLGVVPQELAIYEDLSARENLDFWGRAYGLRGTQLKQRINQVLNDIGLLDRAAEPCKTFSGGMKRRLNFGCGIVHQPQALLLDEPTVGVDPQSRERLLALVRNQLGGGTCVLYTTHYMEEAEQLCDELAIVDHGRVIAAGTVDELRAMMGENDVLKLSGEFDSERVHLVFSESPEIHVLQVDAAGLQLSLPQASLRLPEVFESLRTAGGRIRETTLLRPSLESLFLKLTGKELRE